MSREATNPDGSTRTRTDQLARAVYAGLWPTPTADPMRSRGGARINELTLHKMAKLWPTPTAITDSGGASMGKWGGSGSRKTLREMVTAQELNGALNPAWVEWLMGFPIGWTGLERSETPSCPKSSNK